MCFPVIISVTNGTGKLNNIGKVSTGYKLYECETLTLNTIGRQLGWTHNVFSTTLLGCVKEIKEEEAALLAMEE